MSDPDDSKDIVENLPPVLTEPRHPKPTYEEALAAFDANLAALQAAIEQFRAELDARDLASMAFAREFAREVTPE